MLLNILAPGDDRSRTGLPPTGTSRSQRIRSSAMFITSVPRTWPYSTDPRLPKDISSSTADSTARIPLIQKSVESLGFKMTRRQDPAGEPCPLRSRRARGSRRSKKATGNPRVHIMRGDDRVTGRLPDGGEGQYMYTTSRWAPCKVDRVLEDRDEVKLGGVTLVARLTPGHTRGCTTWTLQVEDGGKKYDVVVIGSPNVNPGFQLVNNKEYPEIAADFARTFEVLKGLPCDVFLGAHGAYYGMVEKYAFLRDG